MSTEAKYRSPKHNSRQPYLRLTLVLVCYHAQLLHWPYRSPQAVSLAVSLAVTLGLALALTLVLSLAVIRQDWFMYTFVFVVLLMAIW